MKDHIASTINSLARSDARIKDQLLEFLADQREAARDTFEAAQTEIERIAAQTKSTTYRDLLGMFDTASLIVEAKKAKEQGNDNSFVGANRGGTVRPVLE